MSSPRLLACALLALARGARATEVPVIDLTPLREGHREQRRSAEHLLVCHALLGDLVEKAVYQPRPGTRVTIKLTSRVGADSRGGAPQCRLTEKGRARHVVRLRCPLRLEQRLEHWRRCGRCSHKLRRLSALHRHGR